MFTHKKRCLGKPMRQGLSNLNNFLLLKTGIWEMGIWWEFHQSIFSWDTWFKSCQTGAGVDNQQPHKRFKHFKPYCQFPDIEHFQHAFQPTFSFTHLPAGASMRPRGFLSGTSINIDIIMINANTILLILTILMNVKIETLLIIVIMNRSFWMQNNFWWRRPQTPLCSSTLCFLTSRFQPKIKILFSKKRLVGSKS